jgi:hypothetical protein
MPPRSGWYYNVTQLLVPGKVVEKNKLVDGFVNLNDKWIEIDPIPILTGLTHAAITRGLSDAVVHMCGGYTGPHPGPATERCFTLDVSKPRGIQWSSLPNLPGQRSGGAMMYDVKSNTLTFATGASRPFPENIIHTIDHFDVWQLDMANTDKGWTPTTPLTYKGNHIGSTSVWYKGKQRHYIAGGQQGESEQNTNSDIMFEWDADNSRWIRRASMLFPRGHFSSSSVPYKNCGFFIAGGRLNGPKTSDISYYDITTDSWHKIGDLPDELNTPTCDASGNVFYCNGGTVGKDFAWKVKIL